MIRQRWFILRFSLPPHVKSTVINLPVRVACPFVRCVCGWRVEVSDCCRRVAVSRIDDSAASAHLSGCVKLTVAKGEHSHDGQIIGLARQRQA